VVQIVAFAAAALVKDIHRLTRLRDPEDQECCIGARRDTAVPVIDVDSRFAETCGCTHEPPCLLKTSAEAMVIKILLKKEMRGNPKRKLSPRRSVRTLCHTHIAAQPAVQIEQDLVRSSHAAACTNCGHLFLSLSVGYQDFGC